MKDAKVTIQKVLACAIYDDPKKCLDCCYREGGYSDIHCTDEDKIVTKVTVEILNPFPKSAKFFGYSIIGTEIQVHTNPKSVTLDGSYNKVSRKFDSEKRGREWADSILKAVVEKGKEVLNKDKVVIDVDLYYQHDDYSYLPSVEKLDEGQTKPSCFGNWRCSKVGWCDCPFNIKETSKPNCFGTYEADNEGCKFCNEDVESCKEETKIPDEKMADVMLKRGMNWRFYHNKHNIIYFPTFQACISYILDTDPTMLSSHQIEEYDKSSNEWREWKSILGKRIQLIR